MARIAGVITTEAGIVAGGAPIFIAKDREDLLKTSHLLEKILDCGVHQVHEDLFILVDRHKNS